jgi:hypothetical protein
LTPIVQTEKQLAAFLDKYRRYFEFFFGQVNGTTLTPLGIKALLEDLDDARRTGAAPEAEDFPAAA